MLLEPTFGRHRRSVSPNGVEHATEVSQPNKWLVVDGAWAAGIDVSLRNIRSDPGVRRRIGLGWAILDMKDGYRAHHRPGTRSAGRTTEEQRLSPNTICRPYTGAGLSVGSDAASTAEAVCTADGIDLVLPLLARGLARTATRASEYYRRAEGVAGAMGLDVWDDQTRWPPWR